MHWPLRQKGQDGGPNIAASGPSRTACLTVMLAGMLRPTAGSAVMVPTSIAVDLGSAAAAARVLVHV
jgi:hypothetical protein